MCIEDEEDKCRSMGVRLYLNFKIRVSCFKGDVTQDDRWLQQWQTVMDFIEANKRRSSKFVDEERGMRNWWKHQQKLLNAGELKVERVEKFKELVGMGEKYRHVNQYQ